MYWVDVIVRCIFWGLILYWLSGFFMSPLSSTTIETSVPPTVIAMDA